MLCLNNGVVTPPSLLSCFHESTQDKGEKKEKKKYEPPVPTRWISYKMSWKTIVSHRVGKKKKRVKGPDAANKLPAVTPHAKVVISELSGF